MAKWARTLSRSVTAGLNLSQPQGLPIPDLRVIARCLFEKGQERLFETHMEVLFGKLDRPGGKPENLDRLDP